MTEPSEQNDELTKLDDEVDDVAWDEFDKEAKRELRAPGSGLFGFSVNWGPLAGSDRRKRLWRRKRQS